MRGAKLKNWIDGIDNCDNYAQMVHKYGVYNDVGFYCDINSENRDRLMKIIENSDLFELYGTQIQNPSVTYKMKQFDLKREGKLSELRDPNFNELEDMISIGLNSYKDNGKMCKNQLNVTFPNDKITFYDGSSFSDVGKEKDFVYTSRFQFMLFGDCENVRPQLSLIVNEFILKNQIPTYVISGNCYRDKYKKFSVFINE